MYDNAANRSYYAIFHAVRALLALEGKDFKKHSGVIACFQKEYVKTGVFPKEMSDIIADAFSIRTESDYKDFYVISHESVIQQVSNAREFFAAVKGHIDIILSDALPRS